MYEKERANQIVEYLKTHKKATIGELAKALFASESTIRRELNDLQNAGLVARFHGGAIPLDGFGEISLAFRAETDAREKDECADIALEYINESPFGEVKTVFIDNSSTCLALAKKLELTNKTVITNGLLVAAQLAQKPDASVILLGGTVNAGSNAVIGSLAVGTLENFNIDLMLSSCAALDENGAHELSLETALIKQTAVKRAKRRVLVATRAKLFADAPYRVRALDAYDRIVTTADREQLKTLASKYANFVTRQA